MAAVVVRRVRARDPRIRQRRRGAQRRLGERWLSEVMSWSGSDQIALPWLAHLGYPITTLKGDVYINDHFDFVPHGQQGRTTR